MREEWYTCTGDLIALSGREKRGIVVIVYEGNEGNARSGRGLHCGGVDSVESSHAVGVELTTR